MAPEAKVAKEKGVDKLRGGEAEAVSNEERQAGLCLEVAKEA